MKNAMTNGMTNAMKKKPKPTKNLAPIEKREMYRNRAVRAANTKKGQR